MQFQIVAIKFDLDSEDLLIDPSLPERLQEECIGQIWEAEDEDDLVEEVTAATGWCIRSIDYRHVLNTLP